MKKIAIIIFLVGFLLQCSNDLCAQKRGKAKTTKKIKPTKKAKSTKATSTNLLENQNIVDAKILNDTIKQGEVIITSSFKPSLKSAAKINFTASPTIIDTNRFSLNYNIPAQNLFFAYQPVPIKPIALANDSSINWENHNYVKLGYGNFSTPFLETALSFGHPNKAHYTATANYVSSKGDIAFQEFTKANIELQGIFNQPNSELIAGLSYNLSNQNKYGINSSFSFTKEMLQQNFNTVGLFFVKNTKKENTHGLKFNPKISANLFTDNRNGSEFNFHVNTPLSKQLSKKIALDLGVTADITNFKNTLGNSIKNNLLFVNSSLNYTTEKLKINAGIQPTWNNQEFSMLLNITVDAKLADEKLKFYAGWIGRFEKNTYQSLTATNPFIAQPTELLNTKVNEQFAGLKGSFSKHISFNAKASLLNFTNMALFVNDTTTNNTQTFLTIYEPSISALSIKGEVTYTLQDKLAIATSVKIMQFTKQNIYDKAFGYLPLELTGTIRYKLFKDLLIKSDLFFWGGSPFRTKTLQSERLSAAIDLNVGAEFAVLNKLNVWLNINNLLNSKYQRWNQYDVLGLNLVGGVSFKF